MQMKFTNFNFLYALQPIWCNKTNALQFNLMQIGTIHIQITLLCQISIIISIIYK